MEAGTPKSTAAPPPVSAMTPPVAAGSAAPPVAAGSATPTFTYANVVSNLVYQDSPGGAPDVIAHVNGLVPLQTGSPVSVNASDFKLLAEVTEVSLVLTDDQATLTLKLGPQARRGI